jgi:hypothetical protein
VGTEVRDYDLQVDDVCSQTAEVPAPAGFKIPADRRDQYWGLGLTKMKIYIPEIKSKRVYWKLLSQGLLE